MGRHAYGAPPYGRAYRRALPQSRPTPVHWPTQALATVVKVTVYLFLSDEWIEEARALRARYENDVPTPSVAVRLNVVVTEIPHRDDDLQGHIDSGEGRTIIEQGHLDEPELTITIDYHTAKAAFVTRDQQVVMQAFIGGKIFVEGDASKLLALQAGGPPEGDPLAMKIYEEMQAFTASD